MIGPLRGAGCARAVHGRISGLIIRCANARRQGWSQIFIQNQQFRKNIRSEVFSQTLRDFARLLCCDVPDPFCSLFARGLAALIEVLPQSIFLLARYAYPCGQPCLWIPFRLNQHAADPWVDPLLDPLEVLDGPWLDGFRHARVPQADGASQKSGSVHANIARDNSPDTQRGF